MSEVPQVVLAGSRALELVLEAHPQLGVRLVNYGVAPKQKKKTPLGKAQELLKKQKALAEQKIALDQEKVQRAAEKKKRDEELGIEELIPVGGHASEHDDLLFEEDEDEKKLKEEEKSLAQKEREAMEEALRVEEEEVTGEKPPELPKALEKLLFMSASEHRPIRLAAASVLALASTDTLVRQVIAGSGQTEVFFDLLEEQVEGINNGEVNAAVLCQAGLVLSKLMALGQMRDLDKSEYKMILTAMMEVLEGKEAQQAESAKSATEDPRQRWRQDERIRNAMETLAYLSLHYENKQLLITTNGGAWFRKILKHAAHDDHGVRYGSLQIIKNIGTSTRDMKDEFNAEMQALKKLAEKSMPNKETVDISVRAGELSEIMVLRHLAVQYGAVTALVEAIDLFAVDAAELEEVMEDRKERGQEQKGMDDKAKQVGGMSKSMAESIAQALLQFASGPQPPEPPPEEEEEETDDKKSEKVEEKEENTKKKKKTEIPFPDEIHNPNTPAVRRCRGNMLQQGALRILLKLSNHTSDKAKADSYLALSRIMITTNPASLPQDGLIFSLPKPLVTFIESSEHELHQFEALIALTNLSSVPDPELKGKCVKEGAWDNLRNCLTDSENLNIQRAAMECMTNLVLCEPILELILRKGGSGDLLFFVIHAQNEEDSRIQLAALGGLAMLSDYKPCSEAIIATQYTNTIDLAEAGLNEPLIDKRDNQPIEKLEVTKTGYTVIRQMHRAHLNQEQKMRVDYIWANWEDMDLVPVEDMD